MTKSLENGYLILEKEIPELQEKLRKKDPKNILLNLVKVDEKGIYYIPRFGQRYYGLKAEEGLNKYVEEMREAIK